MLPFDVISFGLASAGFLALTLLLAIGWDGRLQGGRLIAACALTALWAAVLAIDAGSASVPDGALVAAEGLRIAAWAVTLDGLAIVAGVPRAWLLLLRGAMAAALSLLAVVPAMDGLRAWHSVTGDGIALVVVLLTTLLLLYVLQIAAAAQDSLRKGFLWLLVALGLAFGYDWLVLVWALFGASPGPAWGLRGLVGVLVLPMIVAAVRRDPRWVPRFYVSRHVTFYAFVLIAGAAFVVLVAYLAHLVALREGPAGRAVQGIVVSLALAAFAAVLAMPRVHQRLRVFIAKHFYRTKYDYRAEWLRFIHTLSTAQLDTDPRGSAIRAIAQIIKSPGTVLYLGSDDGTGFSAVMAWPNGIIDVASLPTVPAHDEMALFLSRRQWVIDLQELRSNPQLYGGMALPELLGKLDSARVVLPLLHGSDLIGFVVLDDPATPFEPTFEDRDLLKTVGRHVATHLAQHEADRKLAENRQFEAFHRLTAFVMHDLKNLTAQLALIVANAERHKRNPEFVDDVISTVANSTARMQRLIEQLRGREVMTPHRSVALAEVVARACQGCGARRPQPAVEVLDAGLLVEADPDQLVAALEHLVRNAQDATPEDGSVTVTVQAQGEHCLVTVTDTGCGMTAEFIQQRLFRPFDTTKGSQGMGIGAYQLREYVRSLGGNVEVSSVPGRGTRFVVRLKRFCS